MRIRLLSPPLLVLSYLLLPGCGDPATTSGAIALIEQIDEAGDAAAEAEAERLRCAGDMDYRGLWEGGFLPDPINSETVYTVAADFQVAGDYVSGFVTVEHCVPKVAVSGQLDRNCLAVTGQRADGDVRLS